MIKLKFLCNSIHIFFMSFLSLHFSECLFSSSVFITNNEIFRLSLCVVIVFEIFTFANDGIERSFLQVLIYFMSATTSPYLVFSFSNDFITVFTSCPCFFLIRLKISFRHKVDLSNLKIIDSSFHGNKFKRKISEALYIKQYRPSLNSQEQSVELKVFN